MPGSAHEALLASIHDTPTLLETFITKLRGASLPPGLKPVDSNIRFVETAEVRPDLLLAGEGARHDWAIVELQDRADPDKCRRWLLSASVLLNQTGVLGDVLVITARRSVARWARKVAYVVTKLGTRLKLTPVVFHLDQATVKVLLDEQSPELSQFAAWAMHRRHGPRAKEVVEQAIELTERLPEPLRDAQMRAILRMLSDRMLGALKESVMNLSKIPESPALRSLRLVLEGNARVEGEAQGEARGKAEGEARALLILLKARGISVSDADRAAIEACSDAAQLEQWIERAATAGSVREVLAGKPARRARRAKAVGA
jgi:acylphosphatase